jgi:drug/metabolite transporter (DMT)-like permease
VSQLIGATFLITLAFLLEGKAPILDHLLIGGLAGISGMIGLVALYRGLASGRMGIIAPLTAVVAAAVPVLVGLFREGFPPPTQLVGFGFALIAVWLLSNAGVGTRVQKRELALAIIAGLGFGLFFILIDRVSDSAILWPLVSARAASILFLFIFAALAQHWTKPSHQQLPLLILAGILDAGGNAFFALATRLGRLDIAAVLASFYPAATVLLAWLVLKERLTRQQWAGVFAALVALGFIAG